MCLYCVFISRPPCVLGDSSIGITVRKPGQKETIYFPFLHLVAWSAAPISPLHPFCEPGFNKAYSEHFVVNCRC